MRTLLVGIVLAISTSHAVSAQDEATPDLKTWNYAEKVDPITDRVAVRTFAITKDGDELHSIGVKCDANDPDVYVQFATTGFIGGSVERHGSNKVKFRFDSAAPIEQTWLAESQFAMSPSRRASSEFIDGLRTAHRLAFQIERYDGQHLTTVFELPSDTQAQIDRVLTRCASRPR